MAVIARNVERANELRSGVDVGGVTFRPEAFGVSPPGAQWVLILAKAPNTLAAANIAAGMNPLGVLSLQNGLVDEILRAALPGLLADQGVTFEAAHRMGSSIRPSGSGETLAPPGFEPLVELLQRAGLRARVEPDIRAARLRKLLVNVCINPLTALHRVTNGELETPAHRAQLEALVAEAREVLAAEGLGLDLQGARAAVVGVIRATAANRSSMLQDLEARRPTELEYLTGALLRLARRHGIEAAAHRAVYASLAFSTLP